MPSPFPGMDPYLESHWGDVHHSFITYARDQLRPLLPPDLRARVEERLFVESSAGVGRILIPDVHIHQRGRRQPGPAAAGSRPGTAEPLVLELDEPVTQGSIEIIDAASGNRVVTVIEVLSLTNKDAGEGCDLYLQKRQEARAARVSLVEIDLLRGGRRLLPVAPERLPRAYRTPYQVCTWRGWQPTAVEIYRLPLRERLPKISVPLRPTDADVPLDLQAIVEQCYRNGSYEDDIDYRRSAEPPLVGDDARWADALLRKHGLRRRTGRGRKPRRPTGNGENPG